MKATKSDQMDKKFRSVKPRSRTLKALERAAMRWYKWYSDIFLQDEDLPPCSLELKRACAAHAQSQLEQRRMPGYQRRQRARRTELLIAARPTQSQAGGKRRRK